MFQGDEPGLVSYGEGEDRGSEEDKGEEKPGSFSADLNIVWLHDHPVSVQGYGHVGQWGHVDGDAGQSLH